MLGVIEDGATSAAPAWFLNLQVHEELHCGVDLELIQKFTSAPSAGNGGLLTCDLQMGEKSRESRNTRLSRSSNRQQLNFPSDRPSLFVLKPSSRLRVFLDILSIVVLACDTVTIPFFVAFEVQHKGAVLWLSCMSAAFWMLDLLMQFRTGYYRDGSLEMRAEFITRNYLKGWFALDFAVLTLDIGSILVNLFVSSIGDDLVVMTLVRMAKVMRVLRLISFVRVHRLRGVADRTVGFLDSAAASVGTFVYDVARFLLIISFINHFITCFWCLLGRDPLFVRASDTGMSWLTVADAGGEKYTDYGIAYQYTTGLHWSLTQMTPGSMQVFPVNTIERIYNVVCLLFGMLVFSTLISSLSGSVAQIRIQMAKHKQSLNRLSTFLSRANVSPDLRVHVVKQVDVKLKYQRPLVLRDVEGQLEKLPLSLRNMLHLELCRPLLDHYYFHFLSNAHTIAWEEVCATCVDFNMFAKNDSLFTVGAEAKGMHFILGSGMSYRLDPAFGTSGSVYAADSSSIMGVSPEMVHAGAWLSEASLWTNWRHTGTADVGAAHTCEVLTLIAKNILKCFSKHVLVIQLTSAYALSFYSFLRNSKPPLCEWPNDLTLPFGNDEVIAALPRAVTVVLGQVAVKLLQNPSHNLLSSWMSAVRVNKTEELIREVSQGDTTLLTASNGKVMRCVPLVAVRLVRSNGSLLASLRLVKSARGKVEAACRLPAIKQKAGEYPQQCLQRLLEEKLAPLGNGVELQHTFREAYSGNSQQFGVPTRYIRTITEAAWDETFDAALEPLVLNPHRRQSGNSELSCSDDGMPMDRTIGSRTKVYEFTKDDFYAWLTPQAFQFYSTSHGQHSLYRWLVSENAGSDEQHTDSLTVMHASSSRNSTAVEAGRSRAPTIDSLVKPVLSTARSGQSHIVTAEPESPR
jgi:hypothetical protein